MLPIMECSTKMTNQFHIGENIQINQQIIKAKEILVKKIEVHDYEPPYPALLINSTNPYIKNLIKS